jgi:hypothetical protein
MGYSINLSRFEYPELSSVTNPDGKRQYMTPDGPAPSVTTILGTLPNPELDAWRERVGEEEANRISKEATTIGSYMHDMLEQFMLNRKYEKGLDPLEAIAAKMFQPVRLIGLKDLNEVWGVEVALHVSNIYAGRSDLIGVYKKRPSVIDYKTSIYPKPPKHLEKYKLQTAAYAVANEHLTGQSLDQGVLLIGIRPNLERNVPANCQVVIMDQAEMDHYKVKWAEVLEGFYA